MAGYARGHDVLKIAGLAVVAAISFTALFVYMTNRGLSIRQSDVFVRLQTAEGLRKHDKVFFRGVEVGEVKRIMFRDDGTVLIRAHISEPLPLTTESSAELVAIDLFGRQSVVLKEGARSAPKLLDNDTIAGVPPMSLAMKADAIGRNAERLTGDTTLTLLHDALLGAGEASRSVAALGVEMRAMLAAQRVNMNAMSANAVQVARNLEIATDPAPLVAMRQDIAQSAATFTRITTRLDSASAALATIATSIGSGSGTAGKILHDPALFERTETLLTSLDALVKDLKANPKRYFSVSVF